MIDEGLDEMKLNIRLAGGGTQTQTQTQIIMKTRWRDRTFEIVTQTLEIAAILTVCCILYYFSQIIMIAASRWTLTVQSLL